MDIAKETKETQLCKKITPDEAKKMVVEQIYFKSDLSANLKLLSEDILPRYISGEIKDMLEHQDCILDTMRSMETSTHVALLEAFEKRYWGLAREFTKQLIEEFECKTVGEKALAEVVANAYLRILDNSRRLNNELECTNITHERNVYIANMSKQVDRANRQFLSSLMTLKQLKAPVIELNIKANTAFVSNNQQINLSNETNNDVK